MKAIYKWLKAYWRLVRTPLTEQEKEDNRIW